MTDNENILFNLRNIVNKRKRNPFVSANFTRSYFPYNTNLWNDLPQKIRCGHPDLFKSQLHTHYKTQKRKFYHLGKKLGKTLLTRLRVNRSYLNAHSYYINISPTPQYSCGIGQETSQHILVKCPFYHSLRLKLFDFVGPQVSTLSNLNQKDKNLFTYLCFQTRQSQFLHI